MAADAREAILQRLRAAQSRAPEPAQRRPVFAAIDDPLQRYLAECKANLTEVIETATPEASAAAVQTVLKTYCNGLIYAEDDPRIRRLLGDAGIDLSVMWSSERAIPEQTELSITLTDALIAQTGSLLTSSRHGGRGASAVPATHVVYASTDQVLPDLEAAMRFVMDHRLYDASYVGVITGSSRTADIEKILVHGAHGPRKLVVILERSLP